MKKFLLALPLLVFLGAGCVSSSAPVTSTPAPTPVTDQASKKLTSGEVTIQGVFKTQPAFTNPDVGSTIQVETATYGSISVGLPGFIRCASDPIYRPTVGEKLEVHGNYANGKIDVCSSAAYYIKKL